MQRLPVAYLLYNTLTPSHLALQCTTFPSAFSPYISSPRFHKSHQSLKHRLHLFSLPSSLPLSLLPRPPYSPNILRTPSLTCLSYSTLCSLHIFAASTFAGLSSFGSANMLITLNQDLLDTLDRRPPLRGVLVVVWIVARWVRIEMHTRPTDRLRGG